MDEIYHLYELPRTTDGIHGSEVSAQLVSLSALHGDDRYLSRGPRKGLRPDGLHAGRPFLGVCGLNHVSREVRREELHRREYRDECEIGPGAGGAEIHSFGCLFFDTCCSSV